MSHSKAKREPKKKQKQKQKTQICFEHEDFCFVSENGWGWKTRYYFHCGGQRSSQRRWVVKRPSPWPPEPRPEPMPGFGAMPPRGGGPLPSRSRSIPLPMMPLEPPGPRSLRLISRRSSPPLRVSRSRTALVFFSSTFRRTSPRNMMGCKEERMINTQGSKSFCDSALCCAWRFFGPKVTFALRWQKDQRQNTGVCSQKLWLPKAEFSDTVRQTWLAADT